MTGRGPREERVKNDSWVSGVSIWVDGVHFLNWIRLRRGVGSVWGGCCTRHGGRYPAGVGNMGLGLVLELRRENGDTAF